MSEGIEDGSCQVTCLIFHRSVGLPFNHHLITDQSTFSTNKLYNPLNTLLLVFIYYEIKFLENWKNIITSSYYEIKLYITFPGSKNENIGSNRSFPPPLSKYCQSQLGQKRAHQTEAVSWFCDVKSPVFNSLLLIPNYKIESLRISLLGFQTTEPMSLRESRGIRNFHSALWGTINWSAYHGECRAFF